MSTTVGNEQFRRELRALVDRHITPSSSFIDYYCIAEELANEVERLGLEIKKFSDEDVLTAARTLRH